ncbi:MAG: type IV pilin N-terminal domain-containing protein [Methanoregula sp.]|jgi:FlaG/FlaF family flagellin (archaellin)
MAIGIKETGHNPREAAVSPVIGVMLMIVVTIIIAAVVSAFAGGMTEGSGRVPVAQFDIRLYSHFPEQGAGTNYWFQGDAIQIGNPGAVVMMKSGEPIWGGDLKLVTYRTLSNGTVQKHDFPSQSAPYRCSGGQGTLCLNYGYTSNGWNDSMVFPGETFECVVQPSYVDTVFGPGVSGLGIGDSVTVNIVHTPTNSLIYSQEVRMQ